MRNVNAQQTSSLINSHSSVLTRSSFLLPFFVAWLVLILLSPQSITSLLDYLGFSLLGMLGALFANATGAGGGVVFIPFFNQLAFSESQAIATSFAIQCFGMTAGALTWGYHYQKEKTELRLWQGFKRIIAISGVSAIIGLWWVYGTNQPSPSSLTASFGWFSLLLGLFIVATVYLVKPQRESSVLAWYDYIAIIVISTFGGVITAWLSVGVGELLAIYLILRRFDVTMAVAAAVVVSAITVWAGIAKHTLVEFNVYWQVVVFAGPGAVIGGVFAKTLVSYLSATRLKLFFSFWLLVIGCAEVF